MSYPFGGIEAGGGSLSLGAMSSRLHPPSLSRRLVAEAVGTGLLLATVVGSGIMGDRLSGGNAALALLANSVATGGALAALILMMGPISGAHFNPVVTGVAALEGELAGRYVAPYLLAQLGGALAGVAVAHLMFGVPLFSLSTHARTGPAQWLSEGVATFGLVGVIGLVARHRPTAVPFAVAGWIVAAYWFTASTSFANPAVTFARAFTGTFAGIRAADVVAFVLAQLAGGAAGMALVGFLSSQRRAAPEGAPVGLPQESTER